MRQHGRDPRREIKKLSLRQAHQFGLGMHTHRFSNRFDRANRGLLTEATATETTAASLATGTKRRSDSAIAAMSRRTVRHGRKKDGIGVEWRS
jgi:hypothetical protein